MPTVGGSTPRCSVTHYPDFDYDLLCAKIKDKASLLAMYKTASNYEKLQLFRLMFNLDDVRLDDVARKFCNETYHVENDYLFQLDPRKYDTVPSFVIDRLDAIVREYRSV